MLLHNIPAAKLTPGDFIFYGVGDQPNELVLAAKTLNNKVYVDVKYGGHQQTDMYALNDKFTILSLR